MAPTGTMGHAAAVAAGTSSLRVVRGPSPHPAVSGGDRHIFD